MKTEPIVFYIGDLDEEGKLNIYNKLLSVGKHPGNTNHKNVVNSTFISLNFRLQGHLGRSNLPFDSNMKGIYRYCTLIKVIPNIQF